MHPLPVISKELLSAKPESPEKHKHGSVRMLCLSAAPSAKARAALSVESGQGIKSLYPGATLPPHTLSLAAPVSPEQQLHGCDAHSGVWHGPYQESSWREEAQ